MLPKREASRVAVAIQRLQEANRLLSEQEAELTPVMRQVLDQVRIALLELSYVSDGVNQP